MERPNIKARKARSGLRHGRPAQIESVRYVACPTCGEWLDRSDLAELVRHAEFKHVSPTMQ